MLLGMWTTAATFYGLLFVDFPSLEQLGQLIGHSMVICALVTLVLVPACLPRTRARRALSVTLPGLAAWVQRRRIAVLVAATAVTILLAAGATGLRMDPTLDRLKSATPAALLQEQLAPMFGLPGEVYVIMDEGADLERLLVSTERVAAEIARSHPEVRIQPATSLLPSRAAQARRADILRASGLDPREVDRTLARAAEQEGFRADSFDPFRARVPAMLNGTERLTFDGFAAHGLGDLLERFVVKEGGGWSVASYVYPANAMQVQAIHAALRAAGSSGTLTGLPLVNRELGDRFLPQFLRGLAIGTVVVIVIVVAAFRSWRLSVLALLPTAVGLVWAAGLLALAGIELDLFALFAVVTFVGIGVDYGIHLVQRYRERGDAGAAVAELAPVILVAAGITVLGYGTLVTSSYAPLRSIGLVSAVSVAALAVASVLVLPALLTRRP
jgi:predicted exporter